MATSRRSCATSSWSLRSSSTSAGALDSSTTRSLGRVRAQRSARTAKAEAKAQRRAQRIADKAAGKKLRGPAPKPKAVSHPNPGLAPKTVVNVHRMLHTAWKDATAWQYLRRNVVADASPPRVPRTKRTTWNVGQIQRFLLFAKEDRFFAL